MYWFHAKGKRTSTKTNVSWLKDAISKNKGGCSLQHIELYQQCNKAKIGQCIKAEIDQEGAKMHKEQMMICHQVVAEMWSNEGEDVVAKIKQEVEDQKIKEQNNNSQKGALGALGENKWTPEEYNQ